MTSCSRPGERCPRLRAIARPSAVSAARERGNVGNRTASKWRAIAFQSASPPVQSARSTAPHACPASPTCARSMPKIIADMVNKWAAGSLIAGGCSPSCIPAAAAQPSASSAIRSPPMIGSTCCANDVKRGSGWVPPSHSPVNWSAHHCNFICRNIGSRPPRDATEKCRFASHNAPMARRLPCGTSGKISGLVIIRSAAACSALPSPIMASPATQREQGQFCSNQCPEPRAKVTASIPPVAMDEQHHVFAP